jgi:hypothetical protein
VPEEK